MDSLHVSGSQSAQQQGNSKTSSRSASPCRVDRRTDHHQGYQTHHVKTLSLGSADSSKSDGVATTNSQLHRPTTGTTRHRSPITPTPPSTITRTTPTNALTAGGVTGGDMMDESLLSATTEDPHHHHHHPHSSTVLDGSLLLLGNTTTGTSSGLVTATGGDTADLAAFQSQSFVSNGSGEQQQHQHGQHDGAPSASAARLTTVHNKIVRVKDLIRTEQKLRDDNVYEYLKLASNADKQQVQRIKAVFEKKNQKSAQVISQLQKKLASYQKRVLEMEQLEGAGEEGGDDGSGGVGGSHHHRPPREVLRDMGQGLKNVGGNIRDGITGFSGSVMSKPREFAHLIKNKFGSADNISQMSTWYIGPGATTAGGGVGGGTGGGGGGGGGSEGSGTNVSGSDPDNHHKTTPTGQQPGGVATPGNTTSGHHHGGQGGGHHGGGQGQGGHHHHGSGAATLPATLHSATSHHSVGQQGGPAAGGKFPSDEGSECSSVTSESIERYHSSRGQEPLTDKDFYNMFSKQMQSQQNEIERLRDKIDSSKAFQQEIQFLNNSLQDERFKTERLEEQINDLTELHQNEVENLKQAMADMEEKVQYQSEERLRDIHEMLEHCQTKIQKMEHQALQQQQYVTLEGLDNSNARALVVKLINVLLTVLQVILLLVATCAGIIMPFLRTRVRILTTLTIVFAAVFVLRQWPEVADIGSHVMRRLKDTLDPVK